MPHRIHLANMALDQLIVGIIYVGALCNQAALAVMDFFSERDWDRLMGPHGLAVACLIALVIQWNTGRVAERNKDRRANEDREAANRRHIADAATMDERHKETITMQERNAEKLADLTAESIKASMIVTTTCADLRRSNDELKAVILSSPCIADGRTRIPHMPISPETNNTPTPTS